MTNKLLLDEIDKLIQKYRNARTEEPSTVNHYCNTFLNDLHRLKKKLEEQ